MEPPNKAVSVSLSADGNTAIVGGLSDNGGAGAAWVYTRSGGVWTQQGNKLVGTGAIGAAQQGISVSLSSDGNTAIVGGVERQRRRRSRVGLCADAHRASVRDGWPIAAGDNRAAVQPNPDGERGNAALCVVRGQRSPAKRHRIVTQYGGVVGNADRGWQLHLHREGVGLHHSRAADGDENIDPHRGFGRGSA